jgi:hypothetical protein
MVFCYDATSIMERLDDNVIPIDTLVRRHGNRNIGFIMVFFATPTPRMMRTNRTLVNIKVLGGGRDWGGQGSQQNCRTVL